MLPSPDEAFPAGPIVFAEVILLHAIFIQRFGKGTARVQHFHFNQLTLTPIQESALKKPPKSHHPTHGPVLRWDAALAELLRLRVIRRHLRSSAKESSEVCPGFSALKRGEALWMPKDCLKESENNCNI